MVRIAAPLLLLLALAPQPAAFAQEAPGEQLARPVVGATFPEDKTVKLALAASPHLAEATGEVRVRRRRGVTSIAVELEKMQPAMLFGGDINTYVVWLVTPEGFADNAGEIIINGSKGRLQTATPLASFGVLVTAEPHFLVEKPSRLVVLSSTDAGLAQQKGVGVVPFTWSDFATEYEVEKENLSGLPESKGEIRTDRHQAIIAVRFAEEAGAQEWASEVFEKARAALSSTLKMFAEGAKEKELTLVAHRAVRLAVQAKKLAEERRQAAMLADERKVNRETIERLQKELAAAQSRIVVLEQEKQSLSQRLGEAEERLKRVEKELLEANQEADRLARELSQARRTAAQAEEKAAGFFVRIQNALAQLADIKETDRGLTVYLPDVLFASGSARLQPAAKEILSRIAGVLLVAPEYHLSIEGHTDSTGRASFNQRLSVRRAEAVKKYLEECGISPSMMTARGFGETRPIASNRTAAGRKRNRRVELIIEGLIR